MNICLIRMFFFWGQHKWCIHGKMVGWWFRIAKIVEFQVVFLFLVGLTVDDTLTTFAFLKVFLPFCKDMYIVGYLFSRQVRHIGKGIYLKQRDSPTPEWWAVNLHEFQHGFKKETFRANVWRLKQIQPWTSQTQIDRWIWPLKQAFLHLKISRNPKGKVNVFQPPCFRGYVSFRECTIPKGKEKVFQCIIFQGRAVKLQDIFVQTNPTVFSESLLLAKGDLKLVPGTSTVFFFQSTRWVAGCNDLFVFCFFHQSIGKKPICFSKNSKNPPCFSQAKKARRC